MSKEASRSVEEVLPAAVVVDKKVGRGRRASVEPGSRRPAERGQEAVIREQETGGRTQ